MARLPGTLLTLLFFLSTYSQEQSSVSTQQQSNEIPQPAAVLKVTTRLVVIDVVATDGRGRPVADLKPQDFTLLEDGKPQQVRFFSFQRPQASDAESAAQRALNLPPHVFTNVPAYNAKQALNVILLDMVNSTFDSKSYARAQMIKYLSTIPDGQPVAVYILGRRLRLVQDFTSDPSVLKAAIKSLKGEAPITNQLDPNSPPPGTGSLPAELELTNASGRAMTAAMQQLLQMSENEEFSFKTRSRVTYTLDAMKSLARTLSGYPGRKNLIWISEAFPTFLVPTYDNFEDELVNTAEQLADAEVAVYAVDARGLPGSPFFTGTSKLLNPAPAAMQSQLDAETLPVLDGQNTMREISGLTGGKAYYNRNDLDTAIRNGIEDGSTYYTLAYYPDNKKWNGKFRGIEVKIKPAGIKLRYRRGYYALDPKNQNPKERFSAFAQALSLEFPVSTGLRFEAGVVEPPEKSQKVMVSFAVDPHAISFARQNDGLQHSAIDCAVQAFTEQGKPLKTEGSTLNSALKPQEYASLLNGLLYCHQAIELPPGNYILRLGVLDDHTGLIGTTNARVTINPSASGESKPAEKKASSRN